MFAGLAVLFATGFCIKKYLQKYEEPLYKHKGNYQYSHHGKNKEYYTETLHYSSNCNNHSLVFLFLSGNPGYIRFYDRFLLHLNEVFNKKYDVIGIGQAGQIKQQGSFQRYFNVQQQVDHKIQYFNDLIKQDKYKDSKFVIIGHSFGCYTTLKLINSVDQNRIAHVVMIHPTIDRLVQTPLGKERHDLSHNYKLFFQVGLKFIDYFIPMSLLRFFCLRAAERDRCQNEEDVYDCAENVAQWIGYERGLSFMYLTNYQFQEISKLEEEEIKKFSNKLTVYYAKGDDYTPEYIRKDFKDKFSDFVECFEDKAGLDHSFVFGGAKIKAQLINKQLTGKILNY